MENFQITQSDKHKYLKLLFTDNGNEFVSQWENHKHILRSFINNGTENFLKDCNQFKSYYNYQQSNPDNSKNPIIWFYGKDDEILDSLKIIWNDIYTLRFEPGTCNPDTKPKEYKLAFKLWGLVWH